MPVRTTIEYTRSVSSSPWAVVSWKPRPEVAPTNSPTMAPDEGVADAQLEGGEHPAEDGGEDDHAEHLATAGAHHAHRVDDVLVDRLHALVGVVEGDEEHQRPGDEHLRRHAEAEPEHEERREGGAGDRVEGADDRLHHPVERPRERESQAGDDAGDHARDEADGRLESS